MAELGGAGLAAPRRPVRQPECDRETACLHSDFDVSLVTGGNFSNNGHMRTRRHSPRRPRVLAAAIAVCAVLFAGLSAPAATAAPVDAAVDSGIVKAAAVVGFDPENIINDSLFYDSLAMTSAEIQAFLDAKIGTCTNGKCLNVLRVDGVTKDAYYSQTTGNLVCSAIAGGNMLISEWIYRVQVACGISAKVILVTLQKEQGLTTSKAPSDWNLLAAMGHDCPDTGSCDSTVAGPVLQIYKGTEQLKKYKATAFGKQPGRNWIGYNPSTSCGGTYLNIQNYATAALYNYTPYQPNAAALAAGFSLGDSCSSYGNRNFYSYYTAWFGSTQYSDSASSPFGYLDAVEAAPGVFHVTGWAIDPDTAAPIAVHLYVGTTGTAVTASSARADVGTAYPTYGAAHGFDATIAATGAGDATVCAYGINTGAGSNRLLGCKTLTAMSGSPVGNLDSFAYVKGGVSITGWLIDPDTTASGHVHVYVDGVGRIIDAYNARPDVAVQYPVYGAAHGFSATIPVSAGEHTVCVYGINVGAGSNVTFRCVRTLFPGDGNAQTAPRGSLDDVSVNGQQVTLKGWALDPDTTGSTQVHVYVGSRGTSTTADQLRTDIASAYPAYGGAHGYTATVTVPAGTSSVCVYAIDSNGGTNTTLGCRTVSAKMSPLEMGRAPVGSLDVATTSSGQISGKIQVKGWAIDPDVAQSIAVHLYVDGNGVSLTADESRPDVAAAYPGYGSLHGFSATVVATSGQHTVCAYGINTVPGANTLLGCGVVTVP
ncbi:hypothetical protein [Microbacterium sp.]|uniref:hypothetical protein n=1 Tax=Microbacterium sp. TaxID=51671 RepID=UPI0039E3C34D